MMADQAVVTVSRYTPTRKPHRPSVLDNLDEIGQASQARFDAFANALSDTPDEDAVVEVVNHHYLMAERSMLTIGRYLLRARIDFAGTFMSSIIPRLRVKYRTANMLMELAKKVDEGITLESGVVKGRELEKRLPASYRAAYRLVTLSPHDLIEADRRALLNPNTDQKAVEEFRKALRASRITARAALNARRIEIQAQLDRLSQQQEKLERELMQIDAKLEAPFVDNEEGVVIDGTVEATDA